MPHPSPAAEPAQVTPQDTSFLFLCKPERTELYEPLLMQQAHSYRIFDTPHELLMQCIAHPPQAVLVDVPTQISMRSDVLDLIFDQYEKWPVLRCSIDPSNEPRAMSLTAMTNEGLFTAMDAIAAKDPAWMDGIADRTSMTIETEMRVRYRSGSGIGVWQRSNMLRLSAQGAFIVCYKQVEIGERVQVRFLDLVTHQVGVNATITDSQSWDDGAKLPGFHIEIDPDAQFTHALEEYTRQCLGDLLKNNAIK